VEFTIDISDLVANLPGRAEKRDDFTMGVLKLQEQICKKFNGSQVSPNLPQHPQS
jgi:hypothetical protein